MLESVQNGEPEHHVSGTPRKPPLRVRAGSCLPAGLRALGLGEGRLLREGGAALRQGLHELPGARARGLVPSPAFLKAGECLRH